MISARMAQKWLQNITKLELEEKLLNGGAIAAVIGIPLPWISGEWLGGSSVSYSGLQFYTSMIGVAVLLFQVFVICLTLVPLFGGPHILRGTTKEFFRLVLCCSSALLILAALSVLTSVTFEFSRMGLRYGIYISLIGSILSAIYASLRYHEALSNPDFRDSLDQQTETKGVSAPPSRPQDPSLPEEHRLR